MRCLGLLFALSVMGSAQTQNWPAYHGSPSQSHYSPLQQINTANVARLKPAWSFDTGDAFPNSEMECNPLVVDGVLYATTPKLHVVALNAATGKLLWRFDAQEGKPVQGKQRNRGLVYWNKRIYVVAGPKLFALDSATGKPAVSFGGQGWIDLRRDLGRDPETIYVSATSPGVVFEDMLIMGSIVSEGIPSAPGFIRAYDLKSGKLRWVFKTIPGPGEFGYQTWPADAWKVVGGANAWTGLTLDEKNGTVFVPTGSATYDFYGADRKGDNLFANCLIALNARTGQRLWHYQFVRHDLWDRDLPAPPTLITVKREGKSIDALAQITKSGYVFILDRATGKPLYPVKEYPVPPGAMEGEWPAASEPVPVKPEPFSRQHLTADLLTRRTPEAHAAAEAKFKTLLSTPFGLPSLQGTVVFPGFDGGGEWGGAAFDPASRLLFVNANEMAWIMKLIPRKALQQETPVSAVYRSQCATCHKADRSGSPPEFPSLLNLKGKRDEASIATIVRKGSGRMPAFAQLSEDNARALARFLLGGEDVHVSLAGTKVPQQWVKYELDGYVRFEDAEGYPAIAPPWGTLNALNVDTGEWAWRQPFGEIPKLAAHGLKNTGSENYGGAVVTAGGVLFIAATNYDHKLHAYEAKTGKLLWETELPAAGNATPSTYMVNGRQYVVIAAGGGKSGQNSAGSYVAFALPEGSTSQSASRR